MPLATSEQGPSPDGPFREGPWPAQTPECKVARENCLNLLSLSPNPDPTSKDYVESDRDPEPEPWRGPGNFR